MPPVFTLRAMTVADVPAVSALDRRCFPLPWSAEAFECEARNPVACYRVAEADGELVGYIGAHLIVDEAHITTFGVHPARRGQRLGARLLVDVLRRAVAAGCRRITLEVRESNAPALALYRRCGFAPISRRPRYYTDNDEDALVLWIEDTSRLGFRLCLEALEAELFAETGGE